MPGGETTERNCKLFIGGITFNTTDEILAEFYGRWGRLSDWKAMKDAGGRPRGFGFVTFEDPTALEAAMAERPHVIDGKTVDPKRAIPRDMNSETSLGSVKRVYVGGCRGLDQDALREYFESFGRVEQVEIPLDKESGEPRNFAFVTFDDYDAVDKAVLAGPTHSIAATPCTVKKAQEKGQPKSGAATAAVNGVVNGHRERPPPRPTRLAPAPQPPPPPQQQPQLPISLPNPATNTAYADPAAYGAVYYPPYAQVPYAFAAQTTALSAQHIYAGGWGAPEGSFQAQAQQAAAAAAAMGRGSWGPGGVWNPGYGAV